MAILLREFRDTAIKWQRYTGTDLLTYTDKLLSFALGYIVFKIDVYLDYCDNNGMRDDESIEEFNLRYYAHGERVNAIIRRMIQ